MTDEEAEWMKSLIQHLRYGSMSQWNGGFYTEMPEQQTNGQVCVSGHVLAISGSRVWRVCCSSLQAGGQEEIVDLKWTLGQENWRAFQMYLLWYYCHYTMDQW